jgi:putative nucleotidyltransferase with HDIG domain
MNEAQLNTYSNISRNFASAPRENSGSFKAAALERMTHMETKHPAVDALVEVFCDTLIARSENGEIDSFDFPHLDEYDEKQLALRRKINPIILLRHESSLPALPSVFNELTQIIADPNSTAEMVSEVISRDVGLTAFLLRMVNSAFYGFPSRIDTISRAVALVGTQRISNLALGTTVLSVFKDIPPELVDIPTFWQHSVATGITAKLLAKEARLENPERLFVAGMLHDIGRLIIYKVLPKPSRYMLLHARMQQEPMHDAERQFLGFNHAQLGGIMLQKWNFPFPLVNAVLHHHSPSKSKQPLEPAIINAAGLIAGALGHASNRDGAFSHWDMQAWESIGLPPKAVKRVSQAAVSRIDELFAILLDD